MTDTPKNWYAASTGGDRYVANTFSHQGLVIEEDTGRNVAVAYDKADAPLLAAAPALLARLKAIVDARDSTALSGDPAYYQIDREIDAARDVITQAEAWT